MIKSLEVGKQWVGLRRQTPFRIKGAAIVCPFLGPIGMETGNTRENGQSFMWIVPKFTWKETVGSDVQSVFQTGHWVRYRLGHGWVGLKKLF